MKHQSMVSRVIRTAGDRYNPNKTPGFPVPYQTQDQADDTLLKPEFAVFSSKSIIGITAFWQHGFSRVLQGNPVIFRGENPGVTDVVSTACFNYVYVSTCHTKNYCTYINATETTGWVFINRPHGSHTLLDRPPPCAIWKLVSKR